MALHALSANVFFFASAVNSVVVSNGSGGALLIDTGLDDAHARKLLRAVKEAGLTPGAILNTHAHADHHGGNAFFLKQFPGLPVYAPPAEASVIRTPLLKPLGLYGAVPPQEWQTKFLLAPASPARGVAAGLHLLGGVEVELLPAGGHAPEMYAVRVGEVLYAADALFGPEALAKHPLTFCVDSAAQKASAAALGGLRGVSVTLPGHGAPTPDLAGLVQRNLESYESTSSTLRSVLGTGETVDELLGRVCRALGLTLDSPGAVLLGRAALSAHLSEGLQGGWAVAQVRDNRLLFSQA